MVKKTKKRKIGVFGYDLFPYRTTHTIKGFTDDGSIDIGDGFSMKVKYLEAVTTGERATHVENAIAKAKRDYQEGQEKLRNELMEILLEECPELDRDKS